MGIPERLNKEVKMLKYQQEFLHTFRKDMGGLFYRHWTEIALNKDKIPLNPDWESYEELERSGRLFVFTARSDSKLVGYIFMLRGRHLHYKDHTVAQSDLIYLIPDFRRGWNAVNFFKFAEDCMRQEGVSVIVMGMKHHKPFDVILDRMGYSAQDITYSKYLGD